MVCVACGATIKTPDVELKPAVVSRAALLSMQIASQASTVTWHDVSRVAYAVHSKESKPNSLRVDYFFGFLKVASEWVCFDHTGFARRKAEQWWSQRLITANSDAAQFSVYNSKSTENVYYFLNAHACRSNWHEPTRIATRMNGKFKEVLSHEFSNPEPAQADAEESAA